MWLLPTRERGAALPMRRKGPKAPLPKELPGDWFVLGYDRDRDTHILVVDDEDGSSYNLGHDVQKVMRQFELWGLKEFGNRAIDAAREFRLVQGIPSEDRVIRLAGHDTTPADLIARQLIEKEQEQGHVRHLP